MAFSDRFLSAVGRWQKGWREEANLRLEIAGELESAIAETGLSEDFQTVSETCYRKRFLIPNNPQNGGDLGPLFLNGFLSEGVASWTSEKKFAQEFKDPTREGTIAAIFSHVPGPNEVLLNIRALWEDPSFRTAANHFLDRKGENSDALFHFKFRQSEVILRADLKYDELIHICGRSSPFDSLCELLGLQSDGERDRLWKEFVEADIFPKEAFTLTTEGTRAAMDRAKASFLEKHGSTIESVLAQRG
ncbi:hypothetical protein [uncultured Roseobacter sp.]|uniref:hypothetical protein n=1 Tax=uncultured Roseobacter sp. TaxID=114847 RepID=UPI0026017DA6|nr:hypothetical protein [uncultured Roseobacter sp.]